MRFQTKLLALALLAGLTPAAKAQKSYADEYQNRIKSASSVQSLAETPFGENVDVYSGALSFEQTDLVLEGIGPAIRVMRKASDTDTSTPNPFQYSGFGDWELEVPYIQTLVPGTLMWGSTQGVWNTVGPSGATPNRCTYFGEMWTPPDKYYGPKHITAPAYSWWGGYTLKIPGAGSQTILARLAPAPTPSSGNYPGVTTQHWQVGCQAGLGTTNGQPGEGFVVLSPDGTKYFMTHLSYMPYETYREGLPEDPTLFAHVGRTVARMKASRVEDRFGNYITYGYTGDRLTSISGSDGRQVTIQWWSDAPLIQSVTANGRTWTYDYASRSATGGTLTQVTLPDATKWQFTGTVPNGINLPVLFGACLGGFSYGPVPNSSSGIDATYTVKHPAGATGVFRLSTRLRAQSYAATMCTYDPFSQTNYESSNPFFAVSALVEREISGPGLATRLWTYAYEPEHASRAIDCGTNGCQSTTYTDVTDPTGHRTRYTHSTRYGALQGKLLRVERFDGATLVKKEVKSYNYEESDKPATAPFGSAMSMADPQYNVENLVVPRKNVIIQDGRTFTWEVPSGCPGGLTGFCLDAYGRPTKVTKASSP